MFPYQELLQHLDADIALSAPRGVGAYVTSDMSTAEAACCALRNSFYKKLQPAGNTADADRNALEKFLEINDSIGSAPFRFDPVSEEDSLFWDYFRENFAKACLPGDVSFDLAFMRENLTVGPGASVGCDNESFYTKLFGSQLTMTDPYLLALYRAAASESDTWSLAERHRDTVFGHKTVSGNKLFFVPKTTEISRTCCTEPLLNMVFQQALGAFLEYCLGKSYGISLKTQPTNNRELARLGSSNGAFGTIDLRSASDSISWSLVQQICPPNLLGYFRLFRCKSTVLPNGRSVDLNMISTMGNGFTFPLQTLIFASAIRACYQLMNLSSSCPRSQFGVFGDDLIVRREAYDMVCRYLHKLGFAVNDTKSFNNGPFRESCGYDWFHGSMIRGVYITSLETVSDVYSAINRLNRWSAATGVALVNTVRFLRSTLSPSELKRTVPFSEPVDSGIQVPFDLSRPRVDNNYWFSFRKLVKRSRRRAVPIDLAGSQALGYKDFNSYGWAQAFLGGYARTDWKPPTCDHQGLSRPPGGDIPLAFMTLRDVGSVSQYKVVRGTIPFWDWFGSKLVDDAGRYKVDPYIHSYHDLFSFGGWKAAVTGNR